jgi:hypothetical protein
MNLAAPYESLCLRFGSERADLYRENWRFCEEYIFDQSSLVRAAVS